MKKAILAAAVVGGAVAAWGGMGVCWTTLGWVAERKGDTETGPAVAANGAVTWQLLYAGANGKIDKVDLSAEHWTGGDDVLLAERVVPAGGGEALDGTGWDEWLTPQGGFATFVNTNWDQSGYVFQRMFQGTPGEGTAYGESGLLEIDTGYAGGGQPPQVLYFGDANGFALDKALPARPAGEGTEESPFLVGSVEEWEWMAEWYASGAGEAGAVFRQTTNVVGAGVSVPRFSGTYDGGGHRLEVALEGTGYCVAPFSGVDGGRIEHLVVGGTVKGGIHSSGLVGGVGEGGLTIRDCRVETSVTLVGDQATHGGGVVGHGGGDKAQVSVLEGVAFTGSVTGGANVGGIWGWSDPGAVITLRDCFEAGSYSGVTGLNPVGLGDGSRMLENVRHAGAEAGSPNRNWAWAGTRAWAVEGGEGVTVGWSGAASTNYTAAGIAVHGAGMGAGDAIWAAEGEVLGLALGYAGEVPEGREVRFKASAGTLAAEGEGRYTLAMPGSAVRISAVMAVPGFEGEGTESDPYRIANYAALLEFARVVDEGQTNAWGVLTKDIVAEGTNWVPIGMMYAFRGTFDGAGHTISRLENTETSEYAGLFGHVGDGGVVRNVRLEGVAFNGKCTGGVVVFNNGTVSNCCVSGSVWGSFIAGGVVGENDNTVSNCYNTATVSGEGDDSKVGGIVGINEDEEARVANCHCTGAMSGGQYYTGGVIGWNYGGTVANSYCSKGLGVGAIGVNIDGTVEDCRPLTAEEYTRTNSFIGWDFENVWAMGEEWPVLRMELLEGEGTESEPYLIGSYEELAEFARRVNGGQTNAWGVVTNDIVATETNWTAIATNRYPYSGTFDGGGHTISKLANTMPDCAGLFGYVGSGGVVRNVRLERVAFNGTTAGGIVKANDGTVSNCCVSGSVHGNSYAAGVVGNNEGTVANCFNTATVSSDGNWSFAGGVVGFSDSGTVTNCHSTGAVTGGEDAYVGGVVGAILSSATVAYSYCLDSVGAEVVGSRGGRVEGCEELSASAYTNEASFSGWNFDNVWVMGGEGPWLRVFGDPPEVYDLWVGGKRVSESNAEDVLGDGKVRFEGTSANGTLTLSNAVVTGTYEDDGSASANIYVGRGFDLTIVAVGTNRVENAEEDGVGVVAKGNLVIAGDGVFEAEADKWGIGSVGSLSIVGATVVAKGEIGVEGNTGVLISNATVTATGTGWAGIDAQRGNLAIVDSVVTATGENGLCAQNGGLSVTGASQVDATGRTKGIHGKTGVTMGDGLGVVLPDGGGRSADGTTIVDAEGNAAGRAVIAAAGMVVGSGSEEDPYVIYDYGTLVAFERAVNGGQRGAWGVLAADIVAEGSNWVGIGMNMYNSYDGTFDGAGHTISRLENAGTPESAGLFGRVGQGGVVRNVRLEGVEFNGEYAGGVVGSNIGTVSNCCVSGIVRGERYAGGVVGASSGTVSNCYNTATVSGGGSTKIGGVAGYNHHIVENCHSTGAVSGGSHPGGIVGLNTLRVANSYCPDSLGVEALGSESERGDGCRVLTAAEYTQTNSFIGWNFEGVWGMGPEWPYLRVFGDPEVYPVWVGGKQVWEGNAGDIFGDGTARFEGTATNGTLVLSNAVITNAVAYEGGVGTVGIYAGSGFDLTVSLAGSNRVENSVSAGRGIRMKGNLTLCGEGSLTVKSGAGVDGISADGNLRIEGATVAASGGAAGFASSGNIVLSNATVTATGTPYGMYADGQVAFAGESRVESTARAGEGEAVHGDRGITIGEGLAVVVPVGGGRSSDGTSIVDAEGNAALRASIAAPGTLAGSGTEGNPYVVYDYGTLVAFAGAVNGGQSNAWGVLAADVEAEGTNWVAIGVGGVAYGGTFDGAGHTIAGLKNGEWMPLAGLFGWVGRNGTVRNVRLEGVEFQGNTAGGIAGMIDMGGAVTNCRVSGSVEGNLWAGGVAGDVTFGGLVKDCFASASVACGEGIRAAAGGVAGCVELGGGVANCHGTGEVSGGEGAPVGGVVGTNAGTARTSYCLARPGVEAIGANSGTDDGCAALEAEAYRDEASFSGWDFGEVWGMGPEWPYLRVFGEPAAYPLWVGGKRVWEENAGDILGDGSARFEGTATNGTLVLSNAVVTEAYAYTEDGYTANIYAGDGFDLTVSLAGTNRVANADPNGGGINARGNFTICGAGSLTAEGGENSIGIFAIRSLRIEGATVTASGNTGLSGGGNIVLSNATVSATGDASGIFAMGQVAFAGESRVEATGRFEYAVWADGGITFGEGLGVALPAGGGVSGDGKTIADAGGNEAAHALVVRLYSVTVSGGTTDSPRAAEGFAVGVTAGEPAPGMAFTGWSSESAGVEFADAGARETTFTMPAGDVAVTGTFEEIAITGLEGAGYVYTGAAVEPEVGVELGGAALAAGRDYGVSWASNVDAGTAWVTVTLGGRYAGVQSNSFEIRKRGVTLTSASAEKVYDGTALTAKEVSVGGDGFAAGEGASFEVTGKRTKVGTSTNVFTYALNEGTKEGNYEIETVFGTLRVTKAALAGAEVTAEGQTYDGTAKEPVPVVTWNGKALKAGTDYTVSGWTNNVDAGEGSVTVAGKGNFMGTASGTFAIGKRGVTFTGESGEREYNGGEIALTGVEAEGLVAGHGHNAAAEAKGTDVGRHEGSITAAEDVVILAGEDDVTRNYEVATAAGTLTITPRDITNAVVAEIGAQVYRDAPPTPEVVLTDGEPSIITTNDYVVAYEGNEGAGTATATITGTNNYTGTTTATFEVRWASETVDGVEWFFRTDLAGEGRATVMGAAPAEGELVVPESLDGAAVAGIGAGAFEGCAGLMAIWLPEGVESVGAGAFEGCAGLAEVWVPIERKDSGLLDGAGLPEGCEIVYYGVQKVRFEGNGGQVGVEGMEVEIGGKYGALPEAYWAGRRWVGWFDKQVGGREVTAESVVTEEAERVLWARWGTVRYVRGDGDDGNDGSSWGSAMRQISAALEGIGEQGEVHVGAGTYGAFVVPEGVWVVGEAGVGECVVDGGGAARCVEAGAGAVVRGLTLAGGATTGDGGGALLAAGALLERCVVRGCSAGGEGGGVKGGEVVNCLVEGNEAGAGGGGVAGAAVLHGTVVRNAGGGVKGCGEVVNSIVWGNTGGAQAEGSGMSWSLCEGATGRGCIDGDPGFVDAAGGNWRLAGGSPCVDAGTEAGVRDDLDGAPRPQPGVYGAGVEARADMGCFEFTPRALFVAEGGTGEAPYGSWEEAAGDIQSALDAAEDGDCVVVGAGTYGPIVVSNVVDVVGLRGAEETFIDAGGGGRAVELDGGATLEGFTVLGGAAGDCGGIRADGGSFVRDVVVRGCAATGSGGGVCLFGGSVAEGVAVSNCTAGTGGGFYAAGTSAVVRCEARANAAGGAGGGARIGDGSRLEGCVVAGNEAGSGGGVYAEGGEVADCEVRGNEAVGGAGGGVAMVGGKYRNSVVGGNRAVQGGGVAASEAMGHDCVVAGNEAASGAGVHLYGGECWNCTVADNAGAGAGVALAGGAAFVNGIAWGNAGGNVEAEEGTSVRNVCDAVDPLLTDDYHLRAGSPCIDAGETAEWMAGAYDMDGQPRVEPEGEGRDSRVDLGADEAAMDAVSGPTPEEPAWIWRVVPDARLQLQSATGLVGAAWTNDGAAFTVTNRTWSLEEKFEGSGAKFYRLIWLKE